MEKGELRINKLKPLISDLDSLPFPDRYTYPFRENLKKIGYAPFLFSRGCPYLCSYCSNHAIAARYNLSSNSARYRSPESSIREIEETVDKFSFQKLDIGDDIFGLDKAWREEFCKKYKKRIKIKFSCLLRANLVDENFVRLLKNAGCYRISIGIESGNEYIRNEVMNRKMSNKEIIEAFEIAHQYGLETNAINMIGTPGESEDMIWDTIKINRQAKPTVTGVNIFYPYKGTKLGDHCFKKGLVNERLYNDFSNERRETVLTYPETYRKKLTYYRENWETLVYPLDLKKRFLNLLRKTFVWQRLRALKKYVLSR